MQLIFTDRGNRAAIFHSDVREREMPTNAEARIVGGVIDSALESVKAATAAMQVAEKQIEAFAAFARFEPNTEGHSGVPDLSSKEMRAALAVAKTGQFTMAAKSMGVSQPGLSRQIQRVEKAYGIKVFTRRGTGAEVTTEGKVVLEAFNDVLNALSRSVEAIAKLS